MGSKLEDLLSALRENPFASLLEGEEGDFSVNSLPDPHIDLTSKKSTENLIISFVEYVNTNLKQHEIYDTELKLAFSETVNGTVFHRIRICYNSKKFDRVRYEESTKLVFSKLPRLVKDFYQKNKK